MEINFTPQGIAEQMAVCEAAPAGKWELSSAGYVFAENAPTSPFAAVLGSGYKAVDTGNFFVEAHEAWPAALTEILRLLPFEAEAAALREQVASMKNANRDAIYAYLDTDANDMTSEQAAEILSKTPIFCSCQYIPLRTALRLAIKALKAGNAPSGEEEAK